MKKIMIIDDDQDIQKLMTIFLELEGHKTVTPTDFSNVQKLIDDAQPDILILDVNLQGYNGIEILEDLRNVEKYNDLRVILTSGLDYSYRIEDFLNSDFILKPYMPDELIRKISKTN
jgi:two-component system OmpR family response regulator